MPYEHECWTYVDDAPATGVHSRAGHVSSVGPSREAASNLAYPSLEGFSRKRSINADSELGINSRRSRDVFWLWSNNDSCGWLESSRYIRVTLSRARPPTPVRRGNPCNQRPRNLLESKWARLSKCLPSSRTTRYHLHTHHYQHYMSGRWPMWSPPHQAQADDDHGQLQVAGHTYSAPIEQTNSPRA